MTVRPLPRVVVLGAGFAGLQAVRSLARRSVEVFLLDRNNYHTFTPLLYQVAAAELEPEEIVFPVRSIVRRYPHVHFCLAEVNQIDLSRKVVFTGGPAFPFDYLIVAAGSVPQYFDVPGAAEHAFVLKTLVEAIALRNRILCCFERAIHEKDAETRKRILTFVTVGGGPTGVEFTGALAELVRGPLRKDFRLLDPSDVSVVLLEALPGLLPGMPPSLSVYTQTRLSHMGVDVNLGTPVRSITPFSVLLESGRNIPSETVVWTAGVRGSPKARTWGFPGGRDGRIEVLPTLQHPDNTEVYVIGDLARVGGADAILPMIAPVAIQEGRSAARNILLEINGERPLPFHYHDPGTMVTIGRNRAVVRLGGISYTGFLAWSIWLNVHLLKLIGFRNRLIVAINWAWDYLFYERTVRLILPGCRRAKPNSAELPPGRPDE